MIPTCWYLQREIVVFEVVPNAKPNANGFALQWNKGFKPIFHCDVKPLALGPGVGLDPQRHNFALMLVSKNALPPTPNLKFAFPPTQNPNASQWNMGCVGSKTQISCVGHVHSIFFVSISFALGSQFPVEYGL